VEVEKERYPQAAAIFENSHNQHVVGKARLAYRAYAETKLKFRHREDLWPAMGKILRINTRTDRGVQITSAYIQLGHCLKEGIEPLLEPGSREESQPGSHQDSDSITIAYEFADFTWASS
jgi:hypothetical protein